MSLLMDALKKAELAKRQGQADGASASGEETSTQGGLELEPIAQGIPLTSATETTTAARPPAESNLPPLSSHLEELDAQFLAEAKQAAAARLRTSSVALAAKEPTEQPAIAEAPGAQSAKAQPRSISAEQGTPRKSAAQNLFAAKQAAKPAARKSFSIAIGIFTVLAVCGIGGYFWWQLQPKSLVIAGGAPVSPAPAVGASGPPKPAVTPSAPTVGTTVPTPATGVTGAATKVRTQDDDEDAPSAAKTSVQVRRAPAPNNPNAEPEGPIRVTKAPLKVNPALLRGFDAFNRGDLALAQIEYERAQKSDPRNTDAMHGLAAIALRQGHLDQAEWLYRQISEADPQDTVAIAALINTRGQIDPATAESRLKTLSAAQPELAAPHFSLGNLYARHGRWHEAQQAYFRAYTAEPDNPDILYNLAISLEHLRQNSLAAQYYGQALAAAQSKPAGFNKAEAAARLATLQR